MIDSYVALALLSCIFQGTGNVLQKHGVASRLPSFTVRRMLRQLPSLLKATAANRIWLAGALLSALGSGLMVQAIATGDVSVVLPLSNLTTVVSIGAGVVLLRERIALRELGGVALMLAGAGFLASTAETSAPASLGLAPCLGLFGATALLLATVFAVQAKRPKWISREAGYAIGAGAWFGISNIYLKVATAGVYGALGGFSVVQGDSLRALLNEPSFYLVVACQLAGLLLLQGAYANGRISFVSPITGNLTDVIAVVLGFVLLRETLSGTRLIGIGLVMAGATTILLAAGGRRLEREESRLSRRARPAVELCETETPP